MQGLVKQLIENAIFEIERKAGNKSQRPYLNVSFPRTTLTALYDTGADVCCISETAFNAIPFPKAPVQLNKKRPKFRAANGELLDTLGKFNLTFKIGSREVHHEFYKIRNLGNEDVILGINFIHRYHLNYNTET